jgi:acyl-CoA thioester hydrolase
MQRAEFTFRHALRVRWAEVDRQGVVFNPQYFAYFDLAVTEYWRTLGVRYPEAFAANGSDTFVVSAHAEFHGSAGYDDELELCCRVARIGRSSMQFLFAIFRRDEHLTSGEIVYVNASAAAPSAGGGALPEKRSVPWPDGVKEAVLRFEAVKPEVTPQR